MSKNITEMSFDEIFPDDLRSTSWDKGENSADVEAGEGSIWSSRYDEDDHDYSSDDYGSDISSFAPLPDAQAQARTDAPIAPQPMIHEQQQAPAAVPPAAAGGFNSQPPVQNTLTVEYNRDYSQEELQLDREYTRVLPREYTSVHSREDPRKPPREYTQSFTDFYEQESISDQLKKSWSGTKIPHELVLGLISITTCMMFPLGLIIAVICVIKCAGAAAVAKREGKTVPKQVSSALMLCIFAIIVSLLMSGYFVLTVLGL